MLQVYWVHSWGTFNFVKTQVWNGLILQDKRGISIHCPEKFYDGKPVTLQLLKEYGGVCGAVSKFSSSVCQVSTQFKTLKLQNISIIGRSK